MVVRIEDYEKFKGVHDDIVAIINEANLSAYVAVGILETIKQEIYQQNSEEGKP